jgi:hypothetical protein
VKYISIIEQASKEAVKIFAEKRNLAEYFGDSYEHPQEDYLLTQENPPTFVVSDGVTLNFRKLIESGKKYPNPSPAGEVSKIFCESVIKSVSTKYENFDHRQLDEVFKEANKEVKKHNDAVGKSDILGNPTEFYSATGSFIVFKNGKSYWASICDAFVAHFDKEMNLKFFSSGRCSPYAVINGEEKMVDNLEKGVLDLEKDDRVFVLTDGFEHYMRNLYFLEIFKNWDDSIKSKIAEFSKKMNLKDPENYGHERSLIAVLV